MAESELVPDLDIEELKSVLKTVRQGDLLDIPKITFLWSPDAPSHPSEVEGVEHEEPVMTEEMTLPVGMCVIVSQDCDIRRLPDIEPYLLVCPVYEADEKGYKVASDGMSVRFFAYPQIEGFEDKRIVVDGRMIQSIEKTALLSSHIKRMPCPLTEPSRVKLRGWLGRRLGRDVYPDEIVRSVIDPVEQALKRARGTDAEDVFPCVAWVGVRWTSGKSYCSLLLLTDPALRAKHKVEGPQLELMIGRLRKALNHFAAKAGGDYTIMAIVHDASAVPASDMLEYYELHPDLDSAEI